MKYLYLLGALLFPLFLSAQANYKPGYILTLKGDTVKGFVDYREWGKNPGAVNFKSNLGQVKKYTAKNSAGFGVNGLEYYQSFILPISRDQVSLLNLQAVSDTSTVIDTVYLRRLTTGPHVTLYNYADAIKNRYYVTEGKGLPQELIYQTKYNNTDGFGVQYNYRFHIQLQNLAQSYGVNNSSLGDQIASASYTTTDIVKIVRAINNTQGEETKSLFGARFFAGLGANYTQLKFAGQSPFANSANTSSNTFPEITAGIDLLFNKETQSVFFRLAVSYTADKHTISGSSSTSVPDVTKESTFSYKQNTISVNPQFVYNFYNTESLQAFISAGISLHSSTYNDYKTVETFSNGSAENIKDKDPELKKFWTTMPTLRAGATISRQVEIYVGYMPSSGINTATGFSANITAYQAGVNFLF